MENSKPGVSLHCGSGTSGLENLPGGSEIIVSAEPKPMLRWTPELHKHFVNAVSHLGGPDKATPKSVMRVMGVKGITLYHLKSHLQKFRLGKQPRKEVSTETNKDGRSSHGCGLYIVSRRSNNMPSHEGAAQIAKALHTQIEVQKRLHEQLEFQRYMQLRIESQGKYLQAILEKAQRTLESKTSASAGLEASRAELADLASRVVADCINTDFSRQDGNKDTAYKESHTIYCSSQNYSAGLVGKDHLEQGGNESKRPISRERSRTCYYKEIGAAKLQELGLNGNNGCISGTQKQLPLTVEDHSLINSSRKLSESRMTTDETKFVEGSIWHTGTDSSMQGVDKTERPLMELTLKRPNAKIPLSDEKIPMLGNFSTLAFQDCLADTAAIHTSYECSPSSKLDNCKKSSAAVDLNIMGEGYVSHQGREFDLNACGWGR